MNGVHDMGGMHGFGPVQPERDEPVFHDDWERRALALTLAMGATGQWNLDMTRAARESLPPRTYLNSSYYRIWTLALERLMIERGLVSTAELGRGQADGPGAPLRVLRAEKVKNAMVSLTLMSSREMTALNRKHLKHSGPTDIITFGFRDPAGAVIGDVYICPDVARENAAAFGVPLSEELLRLAVHGALHVLGYEHPEGEARMKSPMWKRQERILRQVLEA